jgi:hypothetical protein
LRTGDCAFSGARRNPLWDDFLAALGATTRKNFLAAGGLHARAKSRGTLAAELARLISAFHMIGSKAADL